MPRSPPQQPSPPLPAWIIIGLLSSSLVLILQIVLFIASGSYAAIIVSFTSTAALILACCIALMSHILVYRYPKLKLERFMGLEVEFDLRARGLGLARSASLRSNRSRRRRSEWTDPDLPPYMARRMTGEIIVEEGPGMEEAAEEDHRASVQMGNPWTEGRPGSGRWVPGPPPESPLGGTRPGSGRWVPAPPPESPVAPCRRSLNGEFYTPAPPTRRPQEARLANHGRSTTR